MPPPPAVDARPPPRRRSRAAASASATRCRRSGRLRPDRRRRTGAASRVIAAAVVTSRRRRRPRRGGRAAQRDAAAVPIQAVERGTARISVAYMASAHHTAPAGPAAPGSVAARSRRLRPSPRRRRRARRAPPSTSSAQLGQARGMTRRASAAPSSLDSAAEGDLEPCEQHLSSLRSSASWSWYRARDAVQLTYFFGCTRAKLPTAGPRRARAVAMPRAPSVRAHRSPRDTVRGDARVGPRGNPQRRRRAADAACARAGRLRCRAATVPRW